MQMLSTPSPMQSAPAPKAPTRAPSSAVGQKDGASSFQRLLDQQQPSGTAPGQSQSSSSISQSQATTESATPCPIQEELAAALIAQGMVILPTDAPVALPTSAVPAVTGTDPLMQALGKQILYQQPATAESRVPFQPLAHSTDGTGPQSAAVNLPQDGLRQQSPVSPAQALTPGQTPEMIKGAPFQLSQLSQPAAKPQQELDGEVRVLSDPTAKPLFQQMEHTPVKVGETPTANVNSPNFEQALAKPIEKALVEGAQTLEIKLTPAHLGNVTVSLTQNQDGTLHVVLLTMTEKTTRLLSEHTGGLMHLLRAGAHPGVQIEVQQSEPSQQYHQEDRQNQGQRDPREQERRQQQERQHTSDNFLQQLRLGLLPLAAEAV